MHVEQNWKVFSEKFFSPSPVFVFYFFCFPFFNCSCKKSPQFHSSLNEFLLNFYPRWIFQSLWVASFLRFWCLSCLHESDKVSWHFDEKSRKNWKKPRDKRMQSRRRATKGNLAFNVKKGNKIFSSGKTWFFNLSLLKLFNRWDCTGAAVKSESIKKMKLSSGFRHCYDFIHLSLHQRVFERAKK